MPKVKDTDCKLYKQVGFKCPGCGQPHMLPVDGDEKEHPVWKFNGDYEKPTFKPSIRARRFTNPISICHSFVTDGKIQFLKDSTHELAGQTVELPEFEGFV